MVSVFVSVENLDNVPAKSFGGSQALFMFERIYGKSLPCVGARDQVIEISPRIVSVNLFNEHGRSP